MLESPISELSKMTYPNVDIIWNFFPLTLIVWNPFRAILNAIFFIVYIPFLPFITLWNFFPETFTMMSINWILLLFEGLLIYVTKNQKATSDYFWILYGCLAGVDLTLFSLPVNLLTQWATIVFTAIWAGIIIYAVPEPKTTSS